MIAALTRPRCASCNSEHVSAHVYRDGKPEVYTCWLCGTKFDSSGVILWAPGKEAQA